MNQALRERAELAEEAGEMKSALALWKEFAIGDDDGYATLRYGMAARKRGLWLEAEVAMNEAYRIRSKSWMIAVNTGLLWQCRTDKVRSESLVTAIGWYAKAVASKRSAITLTLLGAAYAAANDYSRAKEALKGAIDVDSTYEEAFYNLGAIEANEGHFATAFDHFTRALELDPEYAVARKALDRVKRDLVSVEATEADFPQE